MNVAEELCKLVLRSSCTTAGQSELIKSVRIMCLQPNICSLQRQIINATTQLMLHASLTRDDSICGRQSLGPP